MYRRIIWLAGALLLICGPFAWAQNITPLVTATPSETGRQEFHSYLPAPGDRRETVQLNRACRNLENSYKCAQAVEKTQLPRYPQLVSRQGGTLRLTLKSGKVVELKDVHIDGQELDTVLYSFREFLPDLGYYLIHEQPYEGSAYLMVNYQDGKRYRLHDLFLLSPDLDAVKELRHFNPQKADKIYNIIMRLPGAPKPDTKTNTPQDAYKDFLKKTIK